MAWKVVLLSLACLFQAFSVADGAENPASSISFSVQERAYIAHSGPITMCVDPDWLPFERINEQGHHVGIAADLVRLVAQRVGLTVVLYPTKNWEESLAASQSGRCQILSFLNQTPEREQWLAFTAPIFYDPNVIITRQDHAYIGDLHGINAESVALPRGTMVEERIHRQYPNLSVVLTASEEESVTLVSDNKADMTVRSLIVAAYAIRKEGLFNLKIAGQVPEMTNQLRIGVRKDQPVLRDILDKGVATLTPQDRETISNQHVAIQLQQGIDYGLVWGIIAGATALLVVAFFWNRKLSSLNKELSRLSVTDRLTGLFNRLKIDELLESEIHRVQRIGANFGANTDSELTFALIMFDADHFKQVNDRHGHQAGDHVLIEIASLLHKTIRKTDAAGRWGGEEFIIICPQTNAEGAFHLAETLRQALYAHDFAPVGRQTASFGVTVYRPGDTSKSLIARADAALYQAKHQGRDQVVAASDLP
jgi:diguanylate cyclase (GGDEF)-like protein